MKMDNDNKNFLRTYKAAPLVAKRKDIDRILYRNIVPNIKDALRQYPNVLDSTPLKEI